MRLPGTRPSLPLERYVGEYENDWFGRIRVDQVERELALSRSSRSRMRTTAVLSAPGAFDWRLEHWHDDIFRAHVSASGVDMLQFFVTFHVDAKGQVSFFDPGWEPLGSAFVPTRFAQGKQPE